MGSVWVVVAHHEKVDVYFSNFQPLNSVELLQISFGTFKFTRIWKGEKKILDNFVAK